MRLFKYIIPCIILLLSIISIFNIDYYQYDNQYILVEIKGDAAKNDIYKLDKGSTFSDLLNIIVLEDNSDISKYSLSEPLYNKQIIYINKLKNDLISINSSSINELVKLPGIGIKIAELIIEYREKNNGFKYLEELKKIKGIGDKKYENIKDQISL